MSDEFKLRLKRREIDLIISSLKVEYVSGIKLQVMGEECPEEELREYMDLIVKMKLVLNRGDQQ